MVDHSSEYSGEKAHAVLQQFIGYLSSLVIVQWILNIYNGIKYSSKNLEKTFDKVEEGFKVAYIHSLHLYNRYQQTNMNDQAKHLWEVVLTYGFGVVVIMIQLNVTILIALITMLCNALLSGKEVLEHASRSTSNAKATARQMATDLTEKVQQISQVCMEKVEEQTNCIFDKNNRAACSTMDVPLESNDTEKIPRNSFQDISRRILENSGNCVGGFCWAQFDAQSIVECLSNSISLVEIVRQNKSWVIDKVGELRASLNELRIFLEMEGERLKKNPEEMLMCYLQRTASVLFERLRMLEETTEKMMSEQATKKFVTLVSYIEKLNERLVEADNIHELKDEA
ncbi:unnamed protein product [Litomosoides sigmodontis]|uniref:Uncharacterized protein n=1 Tax=Litomosoides sigmodontis TaxID=42156 RepID=A0A3P6TAE7_LITSI|nr:unnamed protein product [Litomosoides sigmodontis]